MAVTPDLVNAASFGPYVVAEVEPNVRTVLQARDSYWGGPVCIEEIEFTFPGSSVANWEAFQAGDFNAAFLRDPRVYAEARDAGTVLSSEFQTWAACSSSITAFGCRQHGRRPCGSVRCHHAISRDIINDGPSRAKLNHKWCGCEGTLLWSPELQECADQNLPTIPMPRRH